MLCLRAKWVIPIDRGAIEDGEVEVVGDTIAYCGPRRAGRAAPGSALVDLGEAVLLPGLVNVHTHLEYTVLRGFLEDVAFFPWIRTLIAAKQRLNPDELVNSARLGALECIRGGITTIGDNTDAGVSARVASEYGMRARIYQEIFGIDQRDPIDTLIGKLDEKLNALSQFASDRVEIGVSPHAPYTVRPELFEALNRYCRANRLRASIHLAESKAESDLIEAGLGPFAEMFESRGIEWSAAGVSPTRYLYDLGILCAETLCVHCVRQSEDDIDLIAASGSSIAHCPKSNAKLGAGIAPLTAWLSRPSIPVGIGTDSAVSNNGLDLFEEMRFGLLARRATDKSAVLTAKRMIEIATAGGARALGLDDRIGVLRAGMKADIVGVRLDGLHCCPATDPYSALVYSARADDVCLTVVNGCILCEKGRFTLVDTDIVRRGAIATRALLSSMPIATQ
jgi:5-methylthioadenosine/S-adenosylhomocysteine deaminase